MERVLGSVNVFGHPNRVNWAVLHKGGIPANKKSEQEKSPGDFATFDKTILNTGYGIAFEKYIATTKSIKLLKSKILDGFHSRVARYGHPANLSKGEKAEYFKARRQDDENDITVMKDNLIHHQLTPMVFGQKHETQSRGDWE